ncbi:MAG: sialate O-acetylesterase [Kiritimatiellales bacterium]
MKKHKIFCDRINNYLKFSLLEPLMVYRKWKNKPIDIITMRYKRNRLNQICCLICVFLFSFFLMKVTASGLNEWSFNKDASGLTLSQATNSGTQSAVFSAGGEGFLETDGNGSLLCTRTSSSTNEMWTNGALLDADLDDMTSGVYYLRYDCAYDLTTRDHTDGSVLGLSVLDESGSNIAGVVIAKGNTNSLPDFEVNKLCSLASSGSVAVILKVDLDTKTMAAWYNYTGDNSFDESSPATSNVPVKLTAINKLQFQATGNFRPEGSDDYAAADHIRTAATWEEITLPTSLPLSFHSIFQKNMVLQRDVNVPTWGHVTPGENVTVRMDDVIKDTVSADMNGRWISRLGTYVADGGLPHVLEVSSGNQTVQLANVVFGDVYLASGQSNMAFPMRGVGDGPATGYSEELASADSFPLIRQTAVSLVSSQTVQEDIPLRINWTECSAASLGSFSAVGYFFAKPIYEETGVPIGIILSAWSGQKIERFWSPSGVDAVPELTGMNQYQEEGGITDLYDIYNSMIAPLIPFGIKGVIWYQGEANANQLSDADIYRFKMNALMRGWRQDWGLGSFPFYFVQLANYTAVTDWAGLRESQMAALTETNSGMAVTIDIGNDSNLHPLNKYDVGQRLARWALVNDYGRNLGYSGPLYQSCQIEDASIRILFDYADTGLMIGRKDSTNLVIETVGPLQNFEIAGPDKNFTEAEAVIDRDTVLVSSSAVSEPMYVRYCYTNAPQGTNKLYNTSGLPAAPFRTDESYRLQVISGSGSASNLLPGATVIISATAQSGKIFDRWIGASSEINNLNDSTATVTMPSHALYLLATYRDTADAAYTNTVYGGYGSGTSKAGSLLNIKATVPDGQTFDHWSGDTQSVFNVNAADTLLRMPATNISVTAVCRPIDSVGDGIDDDWRATWFDGDGSTTNSQSAADADPDGDGMTNKQEFLAGTSPISATSVLRLDSVISANTLALRFDSISGHRYQLEMTDSLIPINWEPVLYNIAGDNLQKELFLNMVNRTNMFYRLRLKL